MEWWMWAAIAIILLVLFMSHSRSAFLRERKRSRQLRIINGIRKKHRLPKLRAYYALDKIAKGHSKYMARHHTCNHNCFSSRAARVRQVTGKGYVGENCYQFPARKYNKKVAFRLVRGWMKSPGHRRNLLNPNYTKIGIGIVSRKGYIYATQIFSS